MMGRQLSTSESRIRRFASDRTAIAAVEFSLVLPMLLAAGLGGSETMRYLLIQRQVSKAAEVAASMVATLDTPFRPNDEMFISGTMQLLVPFAARDAADRNVPWSDIIKVGVGSIRFITAHRTCRTDCYTTPVVIWRTFNRTCGAVPFSASPDITTVPSHLEYTHGTMIVADVSYSYQPWFGSSYLPGITVTRSNFQQPRFVYEVSAQGPAEWNC